jgi:type II secretory pathway pseudopilin PulG
MRRIMLRGRGDDGERGDTLIELMIVMIIFTMIIGIVTTAIVTMMRQVDKQSGLDSNLGNARKAIETLDGQIRFANAITTPGTGSSGDQYVEFQTLETNLAGQPQVCTQWRYHVATSGLQYRTWQVPTSGAPSPSGWLTTALSVTPVGSNPVFSFSAPSPAPAQTPSADANPDDPQPHQSLYVNFVTTDGAHPVSSTSQVGLAAINSTLNSATNNTVCQGVGRP